MSRLIDVSMGLRRFSMLLKHLLSKITLPMLGRRLVFPTRNNRPIKRVQRWVCLLFRGKAVGLCKIATMRFE